ncbi:hypothetical protein FKP32DRAFT_1672060 [Trametes sanguinea]|nr:hypothetical protein FKP32DRAFT_1672060 [Trametes sanguinea]
MASGSITWGPVETLKTMRERIEKTLCTSGPSNTASGPSSSRIFPGHASEEFIHNHRSSSFLAGGEAVDHRVVAGTKRTSIEEGEAYTAEIPASKRLRTMSGSQQSTHQDDSFSTPLTNQVSSPPQPSPHHQTALAAPAATLSRRHVQTSKSATHAAAPHFGQPDAASVPRRLSGVYNLNGTVVSVNMPSSTDPGHWHVRPNAPLNPLSSSGAHLAPL